MRFITGNWTLTETFLHTVAACPTMISAVPEQDRREKLLTRLAETFVRYVEHWNHAPLSVQIAEASALSLFESALKTVGFDATTGALLSSTGTASSVETGAGDSASSVATISGTASGSGSGGLRHETFSAFTVLHFVGHSDLTAVLPTGVWAWSLHTLSTAHGQPAQVD
jgi:hypothetical protein